MSFRQRVPDSEGVTRVEFSLTNSELPFVGVSLLDGVSVLLEELLPRGRGTYAEFFVIDGVPTEHVFDAAAGHGSLEARLLNEYETGGLFEFEVSDGCPVVSLAEAGALPRAVYAADGTGHIEAEVRDGGSEVVESFLDAHPSAELAAKREQPYVTPMFAQRRFRGLLADRLTDRQLTVLRAAHEAGYYEWPRDTTAEELAADLDIASSTLLKHLRAVERTFVRTFFERPNGSPERHRRRPVSDNSS